MVVRQTGAAEVHFRKVSDCHRSNRQCRLRAQAPPPQIHLARSSSSSPYHCLSFPQLFFTVR